MAYWDTSALIKLYAQESDSGAFVARATSSADPPVTSRIALYEAHAIFRRKEAEGALQPGATQRLVQQLLNDVASGNIRITDLSADFEREYGLVLDTCYSKNPPVLLRTFDCIHLASARTARETELVATDKRLRDAGKVLGFSLFPV